MSPNLEQSYKFLLQISEITYTSLKFWVINIPSLYASDLSSGQFAKSAKFANDFIEKRSHANKQRQRHDDEVSTLIFMYYRIDL